MCIMSTIRLNITLPEDVAQKLKKVSNKSSFIAEVLKEKFKESERKKLDQLLIEGYKATRKEDKKINKEWEKATLEKWE